MQDRVPTYPGRVTLTPVEGQPNTYDMARADQPTQEGTPLNTATLLQDATAALMGLSDTAVPDDAFRFLATVTDALLGSDSIACLTVETGSGQVIPNLTLSVSNGYVNSTVTNQDGVAFVRVGAGKTVTVSVPSEYSDLGAASIALNSSDIPIIYETLTVPVVGFLSITSSANVMFSDACTQIDFTAVGGGESGESKPYINSPGPGRGGYGGEVLLVQNAGLPRNTSISIFIGAGGIAPSTQSGSGGASAGGNTLIGSYYTAAGGSISSASGKNMAVGGQAGTVASKNGGNGQNGFTFFSSLSETTLLGAAGGGGAEFTGTPGSGGDYGGGAGVAATANYGDNVAKNGNPGSLSGAGGGGTNVTSDDRSGVGGSGYRGEVAFRMYHGGASA